jgi:hypothetical protein
MKMVLEYKQRGGTEMKVKVSYRAYTDGGLMDRGYMVTIGYFDSLNEAKSILDGLCPWNFDSYGERKVNDFHFETIYFDDIERDALINDARKHAKENKMVPK